MSTDKTKLGIETTAMIIRERLMIYFKGSCVERLLSSGNVSLKEVNPGFRGEFQYVRQKAKKQDKRIVFVGSAPILTIQHVPDKVIFNQKVLRRSPELREVELLLFRFFREYLPAVEIEENNGAVTWD